MDLTFSLQERTFQCRTTAAQHCLDKAVAEEALLGCAWVSSCFSHISETFLYYVYYHVQMYRPLLLLLVNYYYYYLIFLR